MLVRKALMALIASGITDDRTRPIASHPRPFGEREERETSRALPDPATCRIERAAPPS